MRARSGAQRAARRAPCGQASRARVRQSRVEPPRGLGRTHVFVLSVRAHAGGRVQRVVGLVYRQPHAFAARNVTSSATSPVFALPPQM